METVGLKINIAKSYQFQNKNVADPQQHFRLNEEALAPAMAYEFILHCLGPSHRLDPIMVRLYHVAKMAKMMGKYAFDHLTTTIDWAKSGLGIPMALQAVNAWAGVTTQTTSLQCDGQYLRLAHNDSSERPKWPHLLRDLMR